MPNGTSPSVTVTPDDSYVTEGTSPGVTITPSDDYVVAFDYTPTPEPEEELPVTIEAEGYVVAPPPPPPAITAVPLLELEGFPALTRDGEKVFDVERIASDPEMSAEFRSYLQTTSPSQVGIYDYFAESTTTLDRYTNPDGTFRLEEALDDGVSHILLRKVGFTQTEIDRVYFEQDIEARLEPYMELRKVEPSSWSFIAGLTPKENIPDVGRALVEGAVTKEELIALGYKAEDLERAETFEEVGLKQYIPIYGTAATWGVLTAGERALGVIGDIAMVVPAYGWVGKVGSLGLRGISAEAQVLRTGIMQARLTGNIADALVLEARLQRLVRPSIISRAGVAAKTTLYTGETFVTAPLTMAKGLLTAPKQTLGGLWEVTKFPIVHPWEAARGAAALATGKVGAGYPMTFQVARYALPSTSRYFGTAPLAAYAPAPKTGVPRAPGGRTYESMIGARRIVSGLEAGARKPFTVEVPGVEPFKVEPTIHQRLYGARLYHATPSAGLPRGTTLGVGEGGLYASPFASRQWTLASARGITGRSGGWLVFQPKVPKIYRAPEKLSPYEMTGPFRPMGAGAEPEVVFAPGTRITVGQQAEFGTRAFGQRVFGYPAGMGEVAPPRTYQPYRTQYLERILGVKESIRHPLGGGRRGISAALRQEYEGLSWREVSARAARMTPSEAESYVTGYRGYLTESYAPAAALSLTSLPISPAEAYSPTPPSTRIASVISEAKGLRDISARKDYRDIEPSEALEQISKASPVSGVSREGISPITRGISALPSSGESIKRLERTVSKYSQESAARVPYTPSVGYGDYRGYGDRTPYTPYTPLTPYAPYTPYTPYAPYTPYDYQPYQPYQPYTPYIPHTPFTPYTPFTPTTPYQPYYREERTIVPFLPSDDEGEREEYRTPVRLPTWQQGFIKKVVFLGESKPKSFYNPVPKGEGSPYDTFRYVGEGEPLSGEADLGFEDIKWSRRGISFKGDGLETDVGKELPSKTRGQTIHRTAGFQRMA